MRTCRSDVEILGSRMGTWSEVNDRADAHVVHVHVAVLLEVASPRLPQSPRVKPCPAFLAGRVSTRYHSLSLMATTPTRTTTPRPNGGTNQLISVDSSSIKRLLHKAFTRRSFILRERDLSTSRSYIQAMLPTRTTVLPNALAKSPTHAEGSSLQKQAPRKHRSSMPMPGISCSLPLLPCLNSARPKRSHSDCNHCIGVTFVHSRSRALTTGCCSTPPCRRRRPD